MTEARIMNRPFSPRLVRILPWASVVLVALGCSFGDRQRARGSGPVPSGAFALVGTQVLGVETLRRSLGERPVTSAGRTLVDDARIALEARARHPDRAAVVQRGALARGLVETLRERALAGSPPTAEELSVARAALWAELDRPRCVRTVNIMAEVPALGDGQREQVVLARIAEAVRGAPTPEELNRRVQRVPHDGVDIAVLLVPPVTEDGRVYVETPADAALGPPPVEYTRAAAQLTHIGETSGVVGTPTGYHVLMALDILPPRVVPEPERTKRLELAVADRRIEVELQALRDDLSRRVVVWQSPHSATLTSLVWRAQSGP